MENRNLLEVDEGCTTNGRDLRQTRPAWRQRWMARAGEFVVTVCPNGRKVAACSIKCPLRPLCLCAQREFAAANRIEARVWLVIAVSGAALLVVAFVRLLAT